MDRIYEPYTNWEEVQLGMYSADHDNRESHIKNALNLLKAPTALHHFMKRTVEEWEHSTRHNMTNVSMNRQAWLGQAACCLKNSTPAEYTKEAWSLLTDNQREEANIAADKVIKEWDEQNA